MFVLLISVFALWTLEPNALNLGGKNKTQGIPVLVIPQLLRSLDGCLLIVIQHLLVFVVPGFLAVFIVENKVIIPLPSCPELDI